MRRLPHQALAPALLAALLSLAGCGTPPQQAVGTGACPQVLIVGDTSQVTKFQPGDGRDPTDVLLHARKMQKLSERAGLIAFLAATTAIVSGALTFLWQGLAEALRR